MLTGLVGLLFPTPSTRANACTFSTVQTRVDSLFFGQFVFYLEQISASISLFTICVPVSLATYCFQLTGLKFRG